MIYTPREDSYLIEREVKKYARGKKVLDMGAGSGILTEAALSVGADSVLAVDIDFGSIEFLKKKGLNAVQSDLFSKVKGKFDLIIFNPPYLPYNSHEDFESSRITSGGERGDEIILRFLIDLKNYLNKNGIALLVISSLTPRTRIMKILKDKNLKIIVIADEKFFMEELEVWKIDL